MNLNTARRKIAAFVEERMALQGRNLQDVNLLGPSPRCPLINPACPTDLCILPAGHIGSDDHIHVLGTDAYTQAYRYSSFPMAKPGTSDATLIRRGWEEQERLEKRR